MTNGVAETMFPKVPIETTRPDNVANINGSNHSVKSLNVPIKLQAMPIPSRTRPIKPSPNESAMEKRIAPMTPINDRTVIIHLGPTLSKSTLIGIWVSANP